MCRVTRKLHHAPLLLGFAHLFPQFCYPTSVGMQSSWPSSVQAKTMYTQSRGVPAVSKTNKAHPATSGDRFTIDTATLSKAIENAVNDRKKGRTILSDDSFTCLFQAEVKRAVHFLQSEQTKHEMLAKTVLQNMLMGAEMAENHRDMADKLTALYKNAEQRAMKMTSILATFAVQADKELGTSSFGWLERELNKASFSSAFFVVLSDIYQVDRQKGRDESLKWVAPATFERKTIKYWIESGKMTDLLLTAAREAPLLVYGASGLLTKEQDMKCAEGDKLWSSLASSISSVYFDSPDMRLYKERLGRYEGAQLFRIRWYGKKPEGKELVFLELKTHHEDWIAAPSVKERVNIHACDVPVFLKRAPFRSDQAEKMVRAANPKLKGNDLEKAFNLLMRMKGLVVQYDLRPCVRSKYHRVAFQSPESNELRLTVDRNITMIDESHVRPGEWCLEQDEIKESMVTRVPFDVFEVKLAGSDMPVAIQSLVEQGSILEAPKFSKFLTGAAAFNTSKIDTLPYWANHQAFAPLFTGNSCGKSKKQPGNALSHPEGSKRSSSDDGSGKTVSSSGSGNITELDQATGRFDKISKWLKPWSLRRRTNENESKLTILKGPSKRAEPKSYFANERTFIQWISASLLLITISVILLEFDSNHPEYPMVQVGFALLCSSGLMVFYSIYTYLRRVGLLSRGENYGYIDHIGPILLSVAIFCGLVAIIAVFLSIKVEERRAARYVEFQIRPEEEVCIQHEMAGLSRLEYQPSDILVLQGDDRLLVPSLDTIRRHRSTGKVETLITIAGADLEGLAMGDDKFYTLSEVNKNESEIIEMEWSGAGMLGVVNRWKIFTPNAEGIAFVPAQFPGDTNKLYVGGCIEIIVGTKTLCNGVINVYDVPSDNGGEGTELQGRPLNSNLLGEGLLDTKISAMQFFEGVLYVLHDNVRLVRAWDLEGELLSEWKLPPVSKQWEGLALERRGGALRGSRGKLLLHLALDTPPEVWTLVVQEGQQKGEIILPNCASM